MKNYNDFCKDKKCEEYIEWDNELDCGYETYPCTSCQLVGQSYDIDRFPEDCPFIDEIQKIELNLKP